MIHRWVRKQLAAIMVAFALTMTVNTVFGPTATQLWLVAALCTVFALECFRPRSGRV